MDVKLIVVIISQHVHILKRYAVHLKICNVLYFNYNSIKLEKINACF